MLYISSIDEFNDIYGVVDTKDMLEEFFTKVELLSIYHKLLSIGVNILGVVYDNDTKGLKLEVCKYYGVEYSICGEEHNKDEIYLDASRIVSYVTNRCWQMSEKEPLKKITRTELLSLRLRGVDIKGFDSFIKSDIHNGDTVVYGRNYGKIFLIKKDFLEYEDYRLNSDSVNIACFKYFDTIEKMLSFCDTHNITIDNNICFNKDKKVINSLLKIYSHSLCIDSKVYMDCFIRQDNIVIGVYAIIANLLPCIRSYIREVFKKDINLRYFTYSEKAKCFYMKNTNSSYVVSFCLEDKKPKDEAMLNNYLKWQLALKDAGLCVTKIERVQKCNYDDEIVIWSAKS